MNLNDFIEFNPATGTKAEIPKAPGNYLVTIRDIKALPTLGLELVTQQYKGLELIYRVISMAQQADLRCAEPSEAYLDIRPFPGTKTTQTTARFASTMQTKRRLLPGYERTWSFISCVMMHQSKWKRS